MISAVSFPNLKFLKVFQNYDSFKTLNCFNQNSIDVNSHNASCNCFTQPFIIMAMTNQIIYLDL